MPRSGIALNELLGCNLSDLVEDGERPESFHSHVSLVKRKDAHELGAATLSRRHQTRAIRSVESRAAKPRCGACERKDLFQAGHWEASFDKAVIAA